MAVAAVAVAGTAISLYADHKRSRAQEKALNAQASAKEEQAFEILGRSEINIKRLGQEAAIFKERQKAAFAASGVDIGSGVSLIQQEQTMLDLADAIADERRETAFRTEQIRAGASQQRETARQVKKLRPFQAAATTLSGAGRVAGASK